MTEQWQELKETITEMRDNDGTGTQQEVCKFLVNYMDVLEKQMQEPRWIPVSERLPEEKDYCLCCDKDGYMAIGYISKWSKEWCFEDEEIYIDVIAWMPLPKPYEPQESEVNNG